MTETAEDDSHPGLAKEEQASKPTATADDDGGGGHTKPKPTENAPPPLPEEDIPTSLNAKDKPEAEDDGWTPVWDAKAQAYYFFNRYSQKTQWENPRIPEATAASQPEDGTDGDSSANKLAGAGAGAGARDPSSRSSVAGGYNPAIHGDYDPDADYARGTAGQEDNGNAGDGGRLDAAAAYAAAGSFNRYTGKWQDASLTPENFNDENKSRRQLNAYFDVDAAANTHDGRSLKAERAGKRLSKKEVKAFREKRREKKEEKRRAWLRD